MKKYSFGINQSISINQVNFLLWWCENKVIDTPLWMATNKTKLTLNRSCDNNPTFNKTLYLEWVDNKWSFPLCSGALGTLHDWVTDTYLITSKPHTIVVVVQGGPSQALGLEFIDHVPKNRQQCGRLSISTKASPPRMWSWVYATMVVWVPGLRILFLLTTDLKTRLWWGGPVWLRPWHRNLPPLFGVFRTQLGWTMIHVQSVGSTTPPKHQSCRAILPLCSWGHKILLT